MTIFWIVFREGLKVESTTGRSFVVEMFCAFVPWLTFSESLSASTGSVTGRSYLVRKIAFPTEILPVSQITASFVTHGVLLVVLLIIVTLQGHLPGASIIWLPYYAFALWILVAGLGFLLAALSVFHRDIPHGLSISLNILFWATPIVWPADTLPAQWHWLLEYNPVFYIVTGYRESFLATTFHLPSLSGSLYFWFVATVFLIIGSSIFQRLKPSFADVM
jgi:ABC-type polysaccharide/polyol phosphate export permease